MTHTLTRSLSGIALLSMLTLSTGPVLAQDAVTTTQAQNTAVDSGTEQMTLIVGDILEILPSHSLQNPAYSWILTQDRTFLQAARTATFRYRFIQPGTYSLIAEIKSGDGQRSLQRTFVINAKARTPGNVAVSTTPVVAASGSNLSGLVKIDPPMDTNERVILKSGQQLLKLTPLNPEVKPLSLDLDINQDADNDGNPGNDVENQGTFFQLYAEPLSVWFAEPLSTRTLAVVTVGSDGAARVQRIETVSASYAEQQNIIVSPVRITATPGENGSVSFSAVAGTGTPQSTSLLYHWTFGDGQESLIMNPVHQYAADGIYTVSLQVKNLIDGQDVATDQQQVTIQGAGATPSSAASSASGSSSSSFLSGLPIMSILIGLGIFVLFVLFGLGAVFLLSKLRGGKSLDQTFADMEKTIAPKEDSTKNPPALVIPATATPTPKPASPATPTKEDISRREENAASSPTPAATPRIDEKAAPDWLKKGLDTAPKPAATPPPAASPAPTAPKQAPAPTPAPAAVPSTPPTIAPAAPVLPPKPSVPPQQIATPAATPAPSAPVPSWLQATAPTPSPQPQPARVSNPTVTTPAVRPAPVSAPAPTTSIPATPAPRPPVSVPPVPVKPQTPPPPAPSPVTPPQVPLPTPPKPVPPPASVAPLPKPAPVSPPVTNAAPLPPKSVVPAPQPTPAVQPSPPTPVPPVQPNPVDEKKEPVAEKAPSVLPPQQNTPPVPETAPAAPVSPAPNPQHSVDTPIAIIRAESLDKPQGGQS